MKQPKILVIGDVIIDKYIHCTEGKNNPESDAPLYKQKYKKFAWGGAANVAIGLSRLGAQVSLCGEIDKDEWGHYQIDISLCEDRKDITVKTRILLNDKQVARIDYDSHTSIANWQTSLVHTPLA